MYDTFGTATKDSSSEEEGKCHQLLRIYHIMLTIMSETCLSPNDESIFDAHTDLFVALINELAKMWIVAAPPTPIPALPGRLTDMSVSVIDLGWIAPLYYVAVKCRVHRIRLQAIRLLESSCHREGIWDSKIAVCVARNVMAMEERDFYRGIDTDDDFPILSPPGERDLSLPKIPVSYRLREIEVVLAGSPMDRILLFCKQEQDGVECRVLVAEYNVHLQCWNDRSLD